MTINHRLSDPLAAARHASTLHGKLHADASVPASGSASTAAGAGTMAPLALTPLAPPQVSHAASAPHAATAQQASDDDAVPGMVPTARRDLFDRRREELLAQLAKRDFGALPPSWAAISGRLSQEEAASAAAALQLIAARVSP